MPRLSSSSRKHHHTPISFGKSKNHHAVGRGRTPPSSNKKLAPLTHQDTSPSNLHVTISSSSPEQKGMHYNDSLSPIHIPLESELSIPIVASSPSKQQTSFSLHSVGEQYGRNKNDGRNKSRNRKRPHVTPRSPSPNPIEESYQIPAGSSKLPRLESSPLPTRTNASKSPSTAHKRSADSSTKQQTTSSANTYSFKSFSFQPFHFPNFQSSFFEDEMSIKAIYPTMTQCYTLTKSNILFRNQSLFMKNVISCSTCLYYGCLVREEYQEKEVAVQKYSYLHSKPQVRKVRTQYVCFWKIGHEDSVCERKWCFPKRPIKQVVLSEDAIMFLCARGKIYWAYLGENFRDITNVGGGAYGRNVMERSTSFVSQQSRLSSGKKHIPPPSSPPVEDGQIQIQFLHPESDWNISNLQDSIFESEVVRIAAGARHYCALDRSGHVYMWGYPPVTQNRDAAQYASFGSFSNMTHPRKLDIPSGVAIKKVVCGSNFTLLLSRHGGKLYAFGSNASGACGFPQEISVVKDPHLVETCFVLNPRWTAENEGIGALGTETSTRAAVQIRGRHGKNNGSHMNFPLLHRYGSTTIQSPGKVIPKYIEIELKNVSRVFCGDSHSWIMLEDGRFLSAGFDQCGQVSGWKFDKKLLEERTPSYAHLDVSHDYRTNHSLYEFHEVNLRQFFVLERKFNRVLKKIERKGKQQMLRGNDLLSARRGVTNLSTGRSSSRKVAPTPMDGPSPRPGESESPQMMLHLSGGGGSSNPNPDPPLESNQPTTKPPQLTITSSMDRHAPYKPNTLPTQTFNTKSPSSRNPYRFEIACGAWSTVICQIKKSRGKRVNVEGNGGAM